MIKFLWKARRNPFRTKEAPPAGLTDIISNSTGRSEGALAEVIPFPPSSPLAEVELGTVSLDDCGAGALACGGEANATPQELAQKSRAARLLRFPLILLALFAILCGFGLVEIQHKRRVYAMGWVLKERERELYELRQWQRAVEVYYATYRPEACGARGQVAAARVAPGIRPERGASSAQNHWLCRN
jgi:hypothetical protein